MEVRCRPDADGSSPLFIEHPNDNSEERRDDRHALTGNLPFWPYGSFRPHLRSSRFELRHPDIAGALGHAEQHLIATDGQIDFCLVLDRDAGSVSMKYLKRRADRPLRNRIEALYPDTREAVTVGSEVNQVVVPLTVPPRIYDGDPRALRSRQFPERRNVRAARGRVSEDEPAAVRRTGEGVGPAPRCEQIGRAPRG